MATYVVRLKRRDIVKELVKKTRKSEKQIFDEALKIYEALVDLKAEGDVYLAVKKGEKVEFVEIKNF